MNLLRQSGRVKCYASAWRINERNLGAQLHLFSGGSKHAMDDENELEAVLKDHAKVMSASTGQSTV